MSKLIDWLASIAAVLSIWLALLYHLTEYELINYRWLVSLFPVIILFVFAMYAGKTVLWRVHNFNNCNKEAFELQEEIKEARTDLLAKGFVFQ